MAGEALSLRWSGWKRQRPYGQAGRGSVEYWMAGEALNLRTGRQGKRKVLDGRGSIEPSMVWMEAAETIWTGRQVGRQAGEALSVGWQGKH